MSNRHFCDKCRITWMPGDTKWLEVSMKYIKPDSTTVIRQYHFCDNCSGPVKTGLQQIETYVGD